MKTKQSGRTTSTTADNRHTDHLRVLRYVAVILLVVLLALPACGTGGGAVTGGAKALTSQRFVSLADDASEFEMIFKRAPRGGEQADISKNVAKAGDQGLTILKPSESDVATQFLTAYQNSSDDVVTIVGHNEKGRLYFVDGSWVQLERLGVDPDAPLLAVISCQSQNLVSGQAVGIPVEVGYAIAFRTEELFLARLGALDEAARSDRSLVQQELNGALNTAIVERNVKVSAYAMAGLGGGVGVVIVVR